MGIPIGPLPLGNYIVSVIPVGFFVFDRAIPDGYVP